MRMLLEAAMDAFRKAGFREVYPSFDAVPLPKKSDQLFAVLGLDAVQLDSPFPDETGDGVHPFVARVKVSVLVPMHAPVSRAEDFFYLSALPILEGIGAALCETAPPVVDVKLQRLVMSGVFRFRGVYLHSETPDDEEEMRI